MLEISITKNQNPKSKPDMTKLGFGKYFTDHMFIMDYDRQNGWNNPRIVPYGPIDLDPSAMILHYGQEVFEGMKAYYSKDGRILLFRPEKNMARMNMSNDRLCIPRIDEDLALKAICELIKIDRDWIPKEEGTSLYIRPFIIATEPALGVHPAGQYMFIVILSPVGAYYPEGLNPVKIYVENEYVRSVKGGMGFAKTAGNYAASIKAQQVAADKNYTQVLWLDGVHRKYIEEVGTMNVFFKIGDDVITPSLDGSILPGITRMSCIELMESWGINVIQRKLSIDELMLAASNGDLKEAFGTGTAAVISPIGELKYGEQKVVINDGKIGKLSQKLYDTLTGIQWGTVESPSGWVYQIN